MKKAKQEVDTVGQIGHAHIVVSPANVPLKPKREKYKRFTYGKLMEKSSLAIAHESDKSLSKTDQ